MVHATSRKRKPKGRPALVLPRASVRYDEVASTNDGTRQVYRVKSHSSNSWHTVTKLYDVGVGASWQCDHPVTMFGGDPTTDCIHVRTARYWSYFDDAEHWLGPLPDPNLLDTARVLEPLPTPDDALYLFLLAQRNAYMAELYRRNLYEQFLARGES